MAIQKEVKKQMLSDLADRFQRATVTVLTHYQGLSVAKMEALRRHLRNSEVEYRVVKNTLARKAAEGTEVSRVADAFQGPVGVALGYGDPVTPVRALFEFARKEEGLKIAVGVLEGKVVTSDALRQVALLPSREVMLGQMLAGVQSPLYGLAGALQGIQRKLVYALNAVKETKAASEAGAAA